jgi:tetratricopeptide (TPR) repeat protein
MTAKRLLQSSLIPVLLFVMTHSASAQESAADLFRKSYASEAALKYQEAIDAIQPLVEKTPDDYIVNLRMAWLHYLAGKQLESLNFYVGAIRVSPKSVEARNGYVLPLLAQERYEDVEQACRQVMVLDPRNYYANVRLAFALRLQGKLDVAVPLVRGMLELYPSDVSFLLELALALSAQEEADEAKALFEMVLLLDPDNATATQALAPPAAALETRPRRVVALIVPRNERKLQRIEDRVDHLLDTIFRP